MIRTTIAVLLAALYVDASANNEPTYFLLNGNPIAVKYVSGKLVRLPVQDGGTIEDIDALEAVLILKQAQNLHALSPSDQPPVARLSPPRLPSYGEAMFDVTVESSSARDRASNILVWSGSTHFHEITLSLPGIDLPQKKALIADSRRVLGPNLDFRAYKPVGRRIQIEGPVKVRDYGRTAAAPYLAFVDVTWQIKKLPKALSERGIDSMSPFFRVEYVVDTRTDRKIYVNIENTGGVEDRGMRLLKEPGGPLLMAVDIGCSDGAEPMLLDLEHESYGTGGPNDVGDSLHCFPAQ